jgi:hypothetical protein
VSRNNLKMAEDILRTFVKQHSQWQESTAMFGVW